MDQYWRARSSFTLWTFMLVALAYSVLPFTIGSLTGENRFDGIVGIAIGLYVCSHPASNVLDLLFMEGGVVRPASGSGGLTWYLLNLLVLIAGWLAVYIGVLQFTT